MFKKIITAITVMAGFVATPNAHAADIYNSVATAYVTTTISQTVVFDSTMQNGGTFEFSVLAHNGGGRTGQSDTANVKIQFYNSSNTLINTVNTSYSNNLPQPSQSGTANSQGVMLSGNPQADPAVPWTTLSISSTNCGGSCATVAYAKVSMYGVDGSYWAGDYGPWYRAPTLTLNGGTNLLYNPEFGPYNGTNAQGWTLSPALGACQGAWGGSNACIVDNTGTPGRNTTGLVANQNGGGPSATGGTTSGTAGGYNSTMSVSNPSGGGAPSTPTVVSSTTGTPSVTTSNSTGTPTTTTVTNTSTVTSTDANGNQVVTTYYTVTTTVTTPTTTTTTTTPVTVNTYSDGSTQTVNGTPVTTTTTTSTDVVSTTQPALQSVATTVNVPTTSTSSGTAVTTTATTNLPSSSVDLISFSKTKGGDTVTVNKNTTTITDNPYTVTTTVTTPLTTTTTVTPTTTTVDANGNVIGVTYGTPTSTDNTVYQVVSSDQTFDSYTSTSVNKKKDVNVGGTQALFNYNIVNPFIIDPLTTKDGSWANASGSISGNIGASGINFGYQKTVDDITAGVAGQAGQLVNSALNSTMSGTNYSATAYVFKKMEPLWIKGSLGLNIVDVTTKNSISDFGLSYVQTSEQRISYGDLTLYSATAYAGWRPLIGATIVNSEIGSIVESGTSLLSNGLTNSKSTHVMPYVGTRYEVDEDISFEGRVTNTDQYGVVVGVRSTIKKKVFDNTSIFLRGGYDHGNNYNNATVMVGLTIDF